MITAEGEQKASRALRWISHYNMFHHYKMFHHYEMFHRYNIFHKDIFKGGFIDDHRKQLGASAALSSGRLSILFFVFRCQFSSNILLILFLFLQIKVKLCILETIIILISKTPPSPDAELNICWEKLNNYIPGKVL